jgi:tetrahydromethanopterin S-methyltransferase subunit C
LPSVVSARLTLLAANALCAVLIGSTIRAVRGAVVAVLDRSMIDFTVESTAVILFQKAPARSRSLSGISSARRTARAG